MGLIIFSVYILTMECCLALIHAQSMHVKHFEYAEVVQTTLSSSTFILSNCQRLTPDSTNSEHCLPDVHVRTQNPHVLHFKHT